MRFLETFNEVLELAISFRQEPRHKVHPTRGIDSARWKISDFLADFEFVKHVQTRAAVPIIQVFPGTVPAQLAQRGVCASPSGGPSRGGRQARLTRAAVSPAGRATPEPGAWLPKPSFILQVGGRSDGA